MVDKKIFYDIDGIAVDDEKAKVEHKVAEVVRTEAPLLATKITQGEIIMAEVDTQMLTGQHADIRREAAQYSADIRQESARNFADGRFASATQASDIRREIAAESNQGTNATKDARYDIASRVEEAKDSVKDQTTSYFIAEMQATTEAARDLASLKVLTDANAARISTELAMGIEKAAAATALSSEKIATAVALGQSQLSKELFQDGQRTRDLINDLKYHDLNRALVERNAALVEEREGRRHWRGLADQFQSQGQFAAVQSQLQAFQSQLQTATQGTVNFGTMSGNAGRNTSTNNVA